MHLAEKILLMQPLTFGGITICRSQKPEARKGRILFIDAVAEIARERAQSFLRTDHQARILSAYQAFADEPGFATVASVAGVLAADGNLSIARYVKRPKAAVASGANCDDAAIVQARRASASSCRRPPQSSA